MRGCGMPRDNQTMREAWFRFIPNRPNVIREGHGVHVRSGPATPQKGRRPGSVLTWLLAGPGMSGFASAAPSLWPIMSNSLACPHCHAKVTVPSHLAGKNITCPACRNPFAVPAPVRVPEPEGSFAGMDTASESSPRSRRPRQQPSGSKRWVWVAVALVSVAAVIVAVVLVAGGRSDSERVKFDTDYSELVDDIKFCQKRQSEVLDSRKPTSILEAEVWGEKIRELGKQKDEMVAKYEKKYGTLPSYLPVKDRVFRQQGK